MRPFSRRAPLPTEGLLRRPGEQERRGRSPAPSSPSSPSNHLPFRPSARPSAALRGRRGAAGFTLTEMLAAFALLGLLSAMAVPPIVDSFRAQRVRHAAMALRSLLQRARAEAAARAANVAVVFDPPATGNTPAGAGPPGGPPTIAVYLDENHNGVRRREIAAGEERLLRPAWRFDERFPGVEWGAPSAAAGGAPIPGLAVGAARMVSFSPLGSSGAGRITVSGAGVVYSIVIHGGSSRIRLERRAGTVWVPT